MNRRMHKRMRGVVFGAAVAGIALGAAAAVPAAGPAAAPTWDAARWRDVTVRLGTGDFEGRERAAAELGELGLRDMAELKARIAAAADAEVQSRLQARVRELEGPVLTLHVAARQAVRFADPYAITFTLKNHRPEPLRWPAGRVQVVERQWSTGGMGGTARDDGVAVAAGAEAGVVVIPAGGSVTCTLKNTRLNSICVGEITVPFELVSDDAELQRLWNGEASRQTVVLDVQPSLLMEAIWAAADDGARAKAQETFNALLLAGAAADAYDARQLMEATIDHTGAYAIPFLERALAAADPGLQKTALHWFPRATWAVANLNAKRIPQGNYTPPAWLTKLRPGDEQDAERRCMAAAMGALQDPVAGVRQEAVRVLAGKRPAGAMGAVTALLKDPARDVRIEAIDYLKPYAGARATAAALVGMASDRDALVGERALFALESGPALPPLDLLQTALGQARGAEDAARLLALVQEQNGALPEGLVANFGRLSESDRIRMLSAVAGQWDSVTRRLIGQGLKDPRPAVQWVALMRVAGLPRALAGPLVAGYRNESAAAWPALAGAVEQELEGRALFAFVEAGPAAREVPFPAVNGTGPRVSPDGQWVAYTQIGTDQIAKVGLEGLVSLTHVVRADGTGDQVVSDMFLVGWMADSRQVATARGGFAAMSTVEGAVAGEFGVAVEGGAVPPTAAWRAGGDPLQAHMPHTRKLDSRLFPGLGEGAAISPDGRWIGPTVHDGKCDFMDVDGQTARIPVAGKALAPGTLTQAVWSPDGRHVASWGLHGMTILDFQERRVAAESVSISAAQYGTLPVRKTRWDPWAKDGRRLTFVRNRQVWVCGADGGGEQQLTFDATDKSWPAFSPDGRRIAYATSVADSRAGGGGSRTGGCLWVVDVATTLAARVTAPAAGTIDGIDWLNDQTVIFDRLTGAEWAEKASLQTVTLGPGR